MTINNPTYASKATALRGAQRAGIVNPKLVQTGDGRVELRNADAPLYNWDARERSAVKGAVRVVWDICADMVPSGAKRAEIVAACVAAGVALNTAKTQYQHYRAAAGLTRKGGGE